MHRALPPAVVSAVTMLAVAVWPAAAEDAPPATGPDTQVCAEATAAVEVAILGVLQFSPDVYPGDEVPVPADVDAELLQVILGDPDLGAGARAEVEALVALFAAKAVACTAPVEPSTPPSSSTAPPSSTTATPAPTTAPTLPPNADLTGLDCSGFATPADAQEALDADQADPAKVDPDRDGIACEGGGQVQVHPRGGVDTGGWPAE